MVILPTISNQPNSNLQLNRILKVSSQILCFLFHSRTTAIEFIPEWNCSFVTWINVGWMGLSSSEQQKEQQHWLKSLNTWVLRKCAATQNECVWVALLCLWDPKQKQLDCLNIDLLRSYSVFPPSLLFSCSVNIGSLIIPALGRKRKGLRMHSGCN